MFLSVDMQICCNIRVELADATSVPLNKVCQKAALNHAMAIMAASRV